MLTTTFKWLHNIQKLGRGEVVFITYLKKAKNDENW